MYIHYMLFVRSFLLSDRYICKFMPAPHCREREQSKYISYNLYIIIRGRTFPTKSFHTRDNFHSQEMFMLFSGLGQVLVQAQVGLRIFAHVRYEKTQVRKIVAPNNQINIFLILPVTIRRPSRPPPLHMHVPVFVP